MNIHLDETYAECPDGLDCQKCHNLMEFLFNPFHYKVSLCLSTIEDEYQCEEKGKICAYNHSHSDYQLARRAIGNGAPSRLPQNDGMEAYDERD